MLHILGERDFRRYGAAVDVLKDLAPETAIAALTPWLGAEDRQMRVVAVVALGKPEHARSVQAGRWPWPEAIR